jgi:hypothetical protein
MTNLKFGNRLGLAALAMMSVMGSAPGGDIERVVNIGRRSLARKARKNTRRRSQIASGPGSISAKAEVDQLVWAGRHEEARILAIQHFDACGEVLSAPCTYTRG